MANFNKVVLVGRLTRDPEIRSTGSGLKVAGIGFAVTNRKKDQSGQWVDDPMFIDVTAFDRSGSDGGLASIVERFCKKGSQILIEGKLTLDTWDDKNGGGKRSKHKIIADTIQLLDSRGSTPGGDDDGADEMDASPRANNNKAVSRPAAPPSRPAPRPAPQYDEADSGGDSEIPF